MSAAAPPSKRLFIKTYGCQMNVYDSERMAELLQPLGYGLTETADDADLILLNTCHIREKAAEKLYSDLGRIRPLKLANSSVKIGVAGCVAQAEGAQIMARAPVVDFVVGPQSYHRLPELIARDARLRGEAVAADFAPDEKFDTLPKGRETSGTSAFLTVQEGCDKFCTFCVVPYTRGAEYSRPLLAVIDEAKDLAAKGVRELVLLGQNVNAYNGADAAGAASTLARLAYALADIEGLDRIRYTTSHPRDMSDDLIAAHRDLPALMPYLHLPVQSGSDKILKAMNRSHTAADYLRLIEKIRKARPDMAISGDFIVGFPGETEADFEETLTLISQVEYAAAYAFKYSKRPGTPASAAPGQVEEAVKIERLARLNSALFDQQTRFNASVVGRKIPVLFERLGRKPMQVVGRSPYLQPVWAPGGAELIGQIHEVQITSASHGSLSGELHPAPAEVAA